MAARLLLLLSCTVFYADADDGGAVGGAPKPHCINGADAATTPFGKKRIDQLRVGDLVAIGLGQFEPVTTFLHRDPARNAIGLRFSTENDTTLTLSDEHLVFVAPGGKAVLAKNVKIGHRLYSVKGGGYVEETITKIDRTPLEGRYSPLTGSGVVIVNDVLVSCYSQIEDHYLMHKAVTWLMPFTSWESIFGADGMKGNGNGLHWVGDILWHNLRHWFIASS